MDLVKFQPIRVSEDVVSRPLVSELLQDRTSLTVLNAPSGFGKSVLAAQLYERWSGDRLWINVSKWANIDNDLCSFLVDIAQRIAPDWSLNDERVNHTELACRFVELLNNRQHPMLLVFDDIDRKFELNFLNALLANADFIATGHKVIVCSRSCEIGIHQYKTNAHSYRLLNAELLRFTEADVKQRFPEKAENSVLTRLVNECEGWPALVGIVGRECLYGTTETEILSMLGDFARESIEHFLPQPVGE